MNTIIGVIGGFLILIIGGTFLLDLRARHIANARHGEGFENFERHFAPQGVEELVVSSVYRYFEDWMRSSIVKEFPVRPTDTIDQIYGIVDENVEDMVKDVLKETNRQIPNEGEIKVPVNLETVEDVVNFVSQCPKQVA
jgi:hypothetical protein